MLYITSYALVVLGITLALAVIVGRKPIAQFLKVMDHPGAQAHKGHGTPTPLVGGLAAIPPALLAIVYSIASDNIDERANSALFAVAFASATSMVIGTLDDRRHIPAVSRLLICGAIFLAMLTFSGEFIVAALDFQSMGMHIELGLWSVPFTIVCLLSFQNAVNMSDGRNGLVTSLSIVWLTTMVSYGPHPSNLAILVLLFSLIVVLIANLQGKIFLGDAGTYGVGAFIGLTAIWLQRSNVGLRTSDIVAMFSIPVLDMARLFVTRLYRKTSPFSADHDHLHHHLCREVGWQYGLWIYVAIVTLPILCFRFNILSGLGSALLAATLYGAVLGLVHLRRRGVQISVDDTAVSVVCADE